ncbi:hypothetical protein [Antarctobacter jejuensis]|uniref:hypothetical protein n=1 Tax=Antarctobacter jejuensis TaxID=1439938 RepID=UPI003FCFB24C
MTFTHTGGGEYWLSGQAAWDFEMTVTNVDNGPDDSVGNTGSARVLSSYTGLYQKDRFGPGWDKWSFWFDQLVFMDPASRLEKDVPLFAGTDWSWTDLYNNTDHGCGLVINHCTGALSVANGWRLVDASLHAYSVVIPFISSDGLGWDGARVTDFTFTEEMIFESIGEPGRYAFLTAEGSGTAVPLLVGGPVSAPSPVPLPPALPLLSMAALPLLALRRRKRSTDKDV